MPIATAIDPLDHQGLVWSIARKWASRAGGLDIEDLVQEGQIGLLAACEGFDPDRGVKFMTYAHYAVERMIRRAIADKARPVRVPVYAQDAMRHADAGEPFQAGESLLLAESARAIVSARFVRDGDLREYGDGGLAEILPDCRRESDGLEFGDVVRALGDLPDRQARILRLRFGLDGPPLKLHEIGEVLGVSRERVRQIEQKALRALRARLDPDGDGPIPRPHLRTRTMITEAKSDVPSCGSCPKCGRAYGMRARCYNPACASYTLKRRDDAQPNGQAKQPTAVVNGHASPATVEARPAPPAERPPAPTIKPAAGTTAGLVRELDAMRSIAHALDGLDRDSARRALAWVGMHYGLTTTREQNV